MHDALCDVDSDEIDSSCSWCRNLDYVVRNGGGLFITVLLAYCTGGVPLT